MTYQIQNRCSEQDFDNFSNSFFVVGADVAVVVGVHRNHDTELWFNENVIYTSRNIF